MELEWSDKNASMRNLAFSWRQWESWKGISRWKIQSDLSITKIPLEATVKGDCRKPDCRSGDTSRTWGRGTRQRVWAVMVGWTDIFTSSELPHFSNLPCHLLQAGLNPSAAISSTLALYFHTTAPSGSSTFHTMLSLFPPPGLCCPSSLPLFLLGFLL